MVLDTERAAANCIAWLRAGGEALAARSGRPAR